MRGHICVPASLGAASPPWKASCSSTSFLYRGARMLEMYRKYNCNYLQYKSAKDAFASGVASLLGKLAALDIFSSIYRGTRMAELINQIEEPHFLPRGEKGGNYLI